MIAQEGRWRNLKLLRVLLVVAGGLAITLGLVADRIGFGQPGSLGVGQWLVIISGAVIMLIGWLGRRFIVFYKGVAVALLNTLILLALLELGSIAVARSGAIRSPQENIRAESQRVPYYASQEWAESYWQEAPQAENYKYEPYVVWQHQPFQGESININDRGVRETPDSECSESAFRVFVFGGSTMWGWGAPDWGTIPAYLQEGLNSKVVQPVCVVNYGEDGFVSTQSVITLLRLLQSGSVPDLVIFYDGVNDVYAAYETGQPGVHPTLESVAAKFEGRQHPLVEWLRGSRSFSLAETLIYGLMQGEAGENALVPSGQSPMADVNELADSVAQAYLSNYRIVSAVAQEYGFEVRFFWQPHLAVDNKNLTLEEQSIRSSFDPALAGLTAATYQRIAAEAENYVNLWYIADVFEGEVAQLWIDGWGHVTPEGNRLVAEEMLATLDNRSAEQ